jgi:hypothetical protein
MANATYDVGRRVYKGTPTENAAALTAINIDAAKTITLPAIPVGGGGVLEALVVIEGASNSRFTTNGVTPTATVGQLLVPSNGVTSLVLRGSDVISNFKIIGAAAGNAITYQFYIGDIR